MIDLLIGLIVLLAVFTLIGILGEHILSVSRDLYLTDPDRRDDNPLQ